MSNIQLVNLGAYPNDGSGDDLRTAFIKTNSNITELNNFKVESAINIGTGAPLFLDKQATDLRFRTLKAGPGDSGDYNIAVSYDSDHITLTVVDSLQAIEDDINPKLGGNLNLNSFNITGSGTISATELIAEGILYTTEISQPDPTNSLSIYSANTINIDSLWDIKLEIGPQFSGDGGSITLLAGGGGEELVPGSTTGGGGGSVYISGGVGGNNSTFGAGGNVFISGGIGGTPGNVNIRGGEKVGPGDRGSVIIDNIRFSNNGTLTTPSNGQALVWNSAINKWIPGTVAGGGGGAGNIDFGSFLSPSDFSLDFGSF